MSKTQGLPELPEPAWRIAVADGPPGQFGLCGAFSADQWHAAYQAGLEAGAKDEALIRADERERCAKVVEMQVDRWSESNPLLPPPYPRSYLNAAAAAIRAGRE